MPVAAPFSDAIPCSVAPKAEAGERQRLRTLLVDNYDSYTLNLLQLLAQQLPSGAHILESVVVIRNDQYSWATVRDRILPYVDSVVISPGPGRPDRVGDFGVCGDLIRHTQADGVAVLGVCLGHQGIAAVFGGRVRASDVAVHGQTCDVAVTSRDSTLFDGVPDRFKVVRYHSLAVSEAAGEFPRELQVLARAAGCVQARDAAARHVGAVTTREVMALRHRTRPLFGVQFHPESISSDYGAQIIANFGSIARRQQQNQLRAGACAASAAIRPDVAALSLMAMARRSWGLISSAKPACRLRVQCEAVDLPAGCDAGAALFRHLYGDDAAPLWLDSGSGGGMSVMASALTPGSVTVRFAAASSRVSVVRLTGPRSSELVSSAYLPRADEPQGNGGSSSNVSPFWTWMQAVIDRTRAQQPLQQLAGGAAAPPAFQGGWVGYFGYEMRHGSDSGQASAGDDMPDAQLSFVDRCVVIDHCSVPPRAYVLALVSSSSCASAFAPRDAWIAHLGFRSCNLAADWISRQADRIRSWATAGQSHTRKGPSIADYKQPLVAMAPDLPRSAYVAAIDRAQEWIAQGESYEICLTTQFRLPLARHGATIRSAQDMLALYLCLRQRSPVPYGALLWFGDIGAGVASCSPERFLRTVASDDLHEQRWVEMKPIKGTCRRAPYPQTCSHSTSLQAESCCDSCLAEWERDDELRAKRLQSDVKERAENLMIVDLIRHDLNWIAHHANVQVPHLMAIESFASVHQMVSTIRAQLHPNIGDAAALAHCFPPGSMTGAPKLRTVQLLDKLEQSGTNGSSRRGVYSGCLGYFSAHGQSDWSVVIRTAVVDCNGSRLCVGAGGALTILSDPEAEWDEVETKLNSVLPGISQYVQSRQQ